jgi:hypothetical protein
MYVGRRDADFGCSRSTHRVLNIHICVKVKCELGHMQIGARGTYRRFLVGYYEEQS